MAEANHAIDIGDGTVTFKLPVLLLCTVLVFVIGGYISYSAVNFNQIEVNSKDIDALHRAVKTNQEFIKATGGVASRVEDELRVLESLVRSNSQTLDGVAKRFEEQTKRDTRQWDRINGLLDRLPPPINGG